MSFLDQDLSTNVFGICFEVLHTYSPIYTLQLREEEVERRPNAQQFEMKTTVVYISRRSGGGA